MWNKGWRDSLWSELDQPWDLLIIGGGITGAGILREAARRGMRVLLVEARDFASGTSSRSSKLVHGGFRYLKNAQVKLTWESVRERERLLREGRGLVTQLGFLMTSYREDPLPRWLFGLGLIAYDILALKWSHRYYDAYDIHELCPPLSEEGLLGGYRYFDAQTDDARLVLRVLQEAVADGGSAINYAKAVELLRESSGRVVGVGLEDVDPNGCGRTAEVRATTVVNAAGAWSDELRMELGEPRRLRRLRGSHLIFAADRLPLTRAVSLWHPRDGRPVFAFPWDGVTLVGTTDVDHSSPVWEEPVISMGEAEYLMEAVVRAFPDQELSMDDIQATFSGLRPVVDTGKADPSKESREHVLWSEKGMITVAGGKLTTYRLMALDTLRVAGNGILLRLPRLRRSDPSERMLAPLPEDIPFPEHMRPRPRLRLLGRYGLSTEDLVRAAQADELQPIASSPAIWAELRWAARSEGVVHLEDLLLRRVRLGLVLPNGGMPYMERIRRIVQPELGWDVHRWKTEVNSYRSLWEQCYYLPGI